MCPMCMTTLAYVAAGTTTGAGVVGFLAGRLRAMRRRHRELDARSTK
jgi:F420-0:gamma-glutamyl ligase-like protein